MEIAWKPHRNCLKTTRNLPFKLPLNCSETTNNRGANLSRHKNGNFDNKYGHVGA